jgi:hypothetical protein
MCREVDNRRKQRYGCKTLRFAAVLALGVLAACARPLTQNEETFAEALFGETLDAQAVRIWGGLPQAWTEMPSTGVTAEADAPPLPPRRPPEGFCERKPQKAGETVLAAFVLYDHIWFMHDFYEHDSFNGFPVSVPLPTALIMVHELVHVWQWQNRAVTGYTPTGSAGESVGVEDPYYWADAAAQEFLSYGYEQQAAIIEDFACYALFDRRAVRYRELKALLAPVLPVSEFEAALRVENLRQED